MNIITELAGCSYCFHYLFAICISIKEFIKSAFVILNLFNSDILEIIVNNSIDNSNLFLNRDRSSSILLENFNNIKENDQIEAFRMVEKER